MSLPTFHPPAVPTGPRRLLDGGGSERERELLASARRDALPDVSGPRAANVLQAALAALGEPAVATQIEAPGASMAGRSLLGGVLTGTVVAAAIAAALFHLGAEAGVRSEHGQQVAELPAALVEPPPALPRADRGVTAPREPVSPAPIAAAPAAATQPGQPSARARKPRGAQAAARAPSPAPPSPRSAAEGLAAEVRAIEGAQALLGWGQLPQAAAALASYRRRFPAGELRAEADLIEIDLALAGGERARAELLARALLARPGTGGYRARLAPLLEGGSKGGPGDMLERR